MQRVGRALALKFEHEKPAVVPRCNEIDLRMRSEDPKAVFTPVCEEVCALGGVPHSDGLVFAVTVKGLRVWGFEFRIWGCAHLMTRSCLGRNSTLLTLLVWPRIESTSHALYQRQTRHQPTHDTQRTNLAIAHAPQLDKAIISARYNEGLCRLSKYCGVKRTDRTMVGWKAAQLTPRSWPSSTCKACHDHNVGPKCNKKQEKDVGPPQRKPRVHV